MKIAPSNTEITNYQKLPISSLSLDKDDLKKICDILQDYSNKAFDIEAKIFKENTKTEVEYEENIEKLKEGFILDIIIQGSEGESLLGTIETVFSSTNFPDEVRSLHIDSQSSLKYAHNYYPQNHFTVYLDFLPPNAFDPSILPSFKTPNASFIQVNGSNSVWGDALFSKIKKFIDRRPSTLAFIHNHSVYDLLLFLIGLPISFWVCYHLSSTVEKIFKDANIFLVNAIYLYIFASSLYLFKQLFHGLRWVYPLIEFRQKNEDKTLRGLIAIIIFGWFSTFIYDIIKTILYS